MTTIKLVIGSTRPGRFADQAAAWIKSIWPKKDDVRFETIDLKELNLPVYDEAIPASMGKYEHEHTKKLAKLVKEADGFLFLVPEYNHSVNGALKNALDFVFGEWNFKPVSFISYGGGAGGSRAVEQLRSIAAELRMFDLREAVHIVNYWNHLDATGKYPFSEAETKAAQGIFENLIFWSKELAASRAKLTA